MLSRYRVIDLTDERGHIAGFMLAAMGAEVICIEPPGGVRSRAIGPFANGVSLTHWSYNRGKQSVIGGTDTIETLALTADIVLHCGAVEIDLAALRTANPRLVTVSITPFGPTGPKADWAAFVGEIDDPVARQHRCIRSLLRRPCLTPHRSSA